MDAIDSALAGAWDSPEDLPALQTWMAATRTEAAHAQYACLIVKKHFARAGVAMRDEVPTSWFSFGWDFYRNVDGLLRHAHHSTMLTALLAELVEFTRAFSGDYFTSNLLMLLDKFIEQDPPYSLIEPLLPAQARERLGEMKELLWQQWDDDRRRADQMYY